MQWSDIPGWFRWRDAQHEAIDYFGDGSRFVEVGVFLGRSLCSLADVVTSSAKQITIIGVDTARGSGVEGPNPADYQGPFVARGGGTFAGELHRNIVACGFADDIRLIIADSVQAASFFPDASLDWVHLDARHDRDHLTADISAWLPKIAPGGWLSGDDYDPVDWPEVVATVTDVLPDAKPWRDCQWRLRVPAALTTASAGAPQVNPFDQPAVEQDLDGLAVLGPACADALRSMYASEPQRASDGRLVPIDDTTRISVDEGLALFGLVVDNAVTDTLEVGLAYGFSTLYLLAGLSRVGGGRHVAVDPYQGSDWDGIGVTVAGRVLAQLPAMSAADFTHLPMRSESALVDAARTGRRFGLIFIDGYHRFDDVLVDFTLAAHLCPIGGIIVLHDMWLMSIRAVASFLRTNRADFVEIDTGCPNLVAVRRVADDQRMWDHFRPFVT